MNNRHDGPLTNSQIVSLAVYKLGGEIKAIDIEDIAMEAFKCFPERFSWRKYHDRIDLRAIQYALKDASFVDNGEPYLTGSVKHGYMVTPFGKQFALNNKLSPVENSEKLFRTKSTNEKLALERSRLLNSKAYVKFIGNKVEEITEIDFQDFTRVNEYFPDHARRRRFSLIENSVKENEKLSECWSFLKQEFIKSEK